MLVGLIRSNSPDRLHENRFRIELAGRKIKIRIRIKMKWKSFSESRVHRRAQGGGSGIVADEAKMRRARGDDGGRAAVHHAAAVQDAHATSGRHESLRRGRRLEATHIELADAADVLVIAPATANVLAKLAHGIADDALTCIALALNRRRRF